MVSGPDAWNSPGSCCSLLWLSGQMGNEMDAADLKVFEAVAPEGNL
jgi:hypothetical protein